MASPKYGGKVSTPQRYLLDILSLYGAVVKYMYGKNRLFTQFTFPICYI